MFPLIKSFKENRLLVLLIFLIIIFRFIYSINNEFWFPDQDVLQIYLIGLKFYTTLSFPYFGPDLVYTHTHIPGALQAILVSTGWFIYPIPESPHIFLNLLLTSSLLFLAWYIKKRIPQFNNYLLLGWIFLCSWSICYFTRIINPSYVVPAAIIFFIGFYEIIPALTINLIPKKLSYYFLGFSLFWIFQIHMSWVLIIPFIFISFYYLIKYKNFKHILQLTTYFLLGCLSTGIFLLPTFLKYGLSDQSGTSTASVVSLNFQNLFSIFDYLIKFLSYSTFDVTRFIGGDTQQRIDFLKNYLWASPFVLFVTLIGIGQILYLVYSFFSRKNKSYQWNNVKYLTLLTFLLMSASSIFSIAKPGGHSTVLLFPVAMIYSAHCYSQIMSKKYFGKTAIITLISMIIMCTAITMKNHYTISIYTNRSVIVKALNEKNYKLVGARRYEK